MNSVNAPKRPPISNATKIKLRLKPLRIPKGSQWSTALLDQSGLGNEIVGRETLLGSVPVFVAILVWLIRVLMIGSFTLAAPKLIGPDSEDIQSPHPRPVRRNRTNGSTNRQQYPSNNQHFAPAPKPSRRNS